MAVAQWKLTRMEVGEADLFQGDTGAEKELQLLHRLWQAQNRLERSYARAQRELQALQNARLQTGGFEEARLEDDPEAVSTTCEAPEEIADAGTAPDGISLAVHPSAGRLPYPPIQNTRSYCQALPLPRRQLRTGLLSSDSRAGCRLQGPRLGLVVRAYSLEAPFRRMAARRKSPFMHAITPSLISLGHTASHSPILVHPPKRSSPARAVIARARR